MHLPRRWRLVSVFRRGWNLIMAALLRQEPLPQGCFIPEPWPTKRAPEEEAAMPLQEGRREIPDSGWGRESVKCTEDSIIQAVNKNLPLKDPAGGG